MVPLALAVFSCCCFGAIQGQEVVRIPPAEIRGTVMTTRNGRNISAYMGLPYAKSPVGPLRFKNPVLWEPFNETDNYTIMADRDGNTCPQLTNNGDLIGDEDCLNLNVYTPEITPGKLFPTMVYFFGVDFVQGSASSTVAGPDYLLDRDVVLVAANYRLGALGFLSTGDAEAPGNFGLKDQVAALQWVAKYIEAFGGNPTEVTIFGQGAGGASASLHAISDLSKDLFHRYISQSGNALSFWTYQNAQEYKQYAYLLGDYVNCSTSDSRELISCLREVDAYSLVDSYSIFNDSIDEFFTWRPTNEPQEIGGAFLTTSPLAKIVADGVKDCPAILGNVLDEALLFTAELYTNDTEYEAIAKDPYPYVLFFAKLIDTEESPEEFASRALEFYFGDVESSDKQAFIQNLTNYITDVGFRQPNKKLARILSLRTTAPFYLYEFAYRGTYSRTSAMIGSNVDVGVEHGDDLTYLFHDKDSDYQSSESDELMIDIVVDFWTSFAHTGIPSSQNISDPNVWKPYTFGEPSYLKIGNDSNPMDIQQYPDMGD